MNERRITVTLFEDERNALKNLADRERRDIRGQAAILIRKELERRGLLTAEMTQDVKEKTGAVPA